MDDGLGGDFTEIARDDPMEMSISITEGVITGRLYRVRYRCQNMIGYSDYSDVAYILTAVQPAQPTALTVEIVGSDVIVDWLMPQNRGTLIYEAEIKFLNKDSTDSFYELEHCDGTSKDVFDLRRCTIPAAILRQDPFNLKQNDLIVPTIRFRNEIGFSSWSEQGLATYPM